MSFLDTMKNAMFDDDVVSKEFVKKVNSSDTKAVPIPNMVGGSFPSNNPSNTSSNYILNTGIPTTPTTGLGEVITEKFKDMLTSGLTRSIAGSPYLQFQKINAGMKLKIADVATRCIASGSALEAQGISKQNILDGANQALTFLQNESATFQKELAETLSNLENHFKSETELMNSALEQKQNQIKQLSEEISHIQQEKTKLEVDTQGSKGATEVSRIQFNSSLDAITRDINTDINDITKFLGV